MPRRFGDNAALGCDANCFIYFKIIIPILFIFKEITCINDASNWRALSSSIANDDAQFNVVVLNAFVVETTSLAYIFANNQERINKIYNENINK